MNEEYGEMASEVSRTMTDERIIDQLENYPWRDLSSEELDEVAALLGLD